MDQSLRHLLTGTELFNKIGDEQFNALLSRIETTEFPADQVFIAEGEKADSCYILVEGVCQVFTHNDDGDEIILARVESGGYVGEQALLSTTPGYRRASVRTKTNSKLVRIDHAIFREILELDRTLKERLVEIGASQLLNKLQKLPSLFHISQDLFGKIDLSNVKTHESGTPIVAEGDDSDGVYLIVSGKVDILKLDQGGGNELVTQLGKGAIVGEVGVIRNQPREATAVANGSVQTVFIDAGRFRELHDANPQLQRITTALRRAYNSPRRGLVNRFVADFLGMDAVITNFTLQDSRQLYAASVIGKNLRAIHDKSAQDPAVVRFEAGTDASRELLIERGLLVGVRCHGEWEDLDQIYNMVFDQVPISDKQLDHFKRHGEIVFPAPKKKEIVTDEPKKICCKCMLLTRGDIAACINDGATDLDKVIDETGAGGICGSCAPQILEMLGHNAWQAVHIKKITHLTDKIHSYQLVSADDTPLSDYLPGQHIVVQCEINGSWVERAYTLCSAPGANGHYEIAVKREDNGLFTSWLFENEDNIKLIRVSKPTGGFLLDTNARQPAVCFMGGIGITPGVGFARSLVAKKANRPLFIHYSAHIDTDLAYREVLQQLTSANPAIDLILRTTANEGRLPCSDIEKMIQQYPDAEYFICGQDGYERSVRRCLLDGGVPGERIFVEKFTPAAGA